MKRRDVRQPRPSPLLASEGAAGAPSSIPQSAFCRRHSVRSELEHKLRSRSEGVITYHLQTGLSTWPETRDALVKIDEAMSDHGYVIHRYGVCLDRAMGLPESMRGTAAKETGPRLSSEEWAEIAEAAPIQPHMGDFMIGTPAGFENTIRALSAGATTIGNLGQYFAFDTAEVDDVAITEATVKALGAMAAARPAGAIVHSYLDDGVAMQLSHYGSYVGWAALELYIVEHLLGARLGHSFGGLVPDPRTRAILNVALDDLRNGDSVGTMVYGNTVDYSSDHVHNAAVLSTYLLVDIAAQLHRPTGHAVNPVPLTEAERIPTADEIIEVHRVAREIEREARRSGALFDWATIDRLGSETAEFGRAFAARVLALLEEDGIDVRDAAQVLLALRRSDPVDLEQRANLTAPAEIARLEPWKAVQVREFVSLISARAPDLHGRRVVLAVLEAHDVVRDALAKGLAGRGCEVVLLPSGSTVAQLARAASDEDAAALIVGTYNGAALTLGQEIQAALRKDGYEGAVFFGGRLNQDVLGGMPRDVREDLQKLGIVPIERADELAPMLAELPAAV